MDPHLDEFPGFSTKFRLKLKFGDISANFRDAYNCPNPRKFSNNISLCSKYHGENSAKMPLSRKLVANFRANFLSVLQAFLRKVQTPFAHFESKTFGQYCIRNAQGGPLISVFDKVSVFCYNFSLTLNFSFKENKKPPVLGSWTCF